MYWMDDRWEFKRDIAVQNIPSIISSPKHSLVSSFPVNTILQDLLVFKHPVFLALERQKNNTN